MTLFRKIITVLFSIALIATQCPTLFAQDAGYIEDDGATLWDDQQFLDSTGREFETQDTQYVGEDEIKAAEDAAAQAGLPSINLAAALERDKELMPDNITYGIITGAAMGAWLAMFQGSSARENARYLSLGVLGGIILSVVVGTKSLYTQSGGGYSSLNPVLTTPATNLSASSNTGVSFGLTDTGRDLGATLSYDLTF